MQYNPAWQTRLICELSTLCHLLIMIHQSIFQIMAAMTTAATLAAVGAERAEEATVHRLYHVPH
ncbi:hypothetical protein ABW45_01145 [Stenotrophomonas maltophilia]|uniref:Transmembrane protein n=1 Tax=Stenotrophomonas maltophilia TaxID=40324 RepID=A0AB34TCI0_STEMA|nr:hypothetical protein VL23_20250 [Stenotrophomonas maltophilia]KOQ79721.1 hypothetical protein ABW45_01145 [Stenotrophomonas maltophilia]